MEPDASKPGEILKPDDIHKGTALLVMDIQGATMKMAKDSASLLQSIGKAIQTARSLNMPVLYVVIGFRKGYPEVSPFNRSFSLLKNGDRGFDTEEGMRPHADVAPEQGDIVITKKRVSAFAGSDLEVVLRSLGIKRLVLTGFATGGVVLSTLRAAADLDYTLTVLSDGCQDMDEEVHRVLMTKVFPRQAEVLPTDEWRIRNQI